MGWATSGCFIVLRSFMKRHLVVAFVLGRKERKVEGFDDGVECEVIFGLYDLGFRKFSVFCDYWGFWMWSSSSVPAENMSDEDV